MTTAPPPARRQKRWYTSWWAITLYAVIGMCTLGTIVGALGDDDDDDDRDEISEELDDAAGDMEDAADDFADAADDLGAVEFEDSFEAYTETGTGDGTITLPEGATEGMVTASHDGDSNFSVNVLDTGNQPTLDLLVNTIGSYEGTTAFGLYDLGEEPASLQITADGDWEITIASFDEAPRMELPVESDGDAVYLYDGGAADWAITHDGDSNFMVNQFPLEGIMGLSPLVNEIGSYEGTVPVTDDVAIVTIVADGSWKITTP